MDPADYPADSPPDPFFIRLLCAQPFSGWCVPAATARSGSCGRCGLTAVDCGQLSWRTCTEPIYRPPCGDKAAEGVVFACIEEARAGCGWVQKAVLWWSFS